MTDGSNSAMSLHHLMQAIVTVLAVINPVVCGSIFLTLTSDLDLRQKRLAAIRVALSILIILAGSALIGLRVLSVFGISLDVFQIVGGIIIAFMGFGMLGGGHQPAQAPPSAATGSHIPNSLAPLVMFAAGPGTITVYEVGTVKDVAVASDRHRRYVSVDGGMSDNIRTSLYGAEYDVRMLSRVTDAAPTLSRVVGKHCESGDIVVRDAWMPDDVVPGDLLGVAATGAYCYSMSSRYNLIGRPAVVAVRDGRARLILRRETVDDLLSLEVR